MLQLIILVCVLRNSELNLDRPRPIYFRTYQLKLRILNAPLLKKFRLGDLSLLYIFSPYHFQVYTGSSENRISLR